jgi:hypothetical protein
VLHFEITRQHQGFSRRAEMLQPGQRSDGRSAAIGNVQHLPV